MDEVLMTPDMCMRFLVWSYYYHDIIPQKVHSYSECGLFSDGDAIRLDQIKDTLFKCFTEESVINAVHHFQEAKIRKEPCPFSQNELDMMFAKEMK